MKIEHLPGTTRHHLTAVLTILLLLTSILVARADDPKPPPIKTLACEEKCGQIYVAAEVVDKVVPTFPVTEAGYFGTVYSEGIIIVRYVVGTDGHTKDVAVDELLGPPDMGERAVKAISAWTFKPATQDGKPVEEPKKMRFVFVVDHAPKVAREEVGRDYRHAQSLAREGKVDEAMVEFTTLLKEPKLNFYERMTISYSVALLYTAKKDYLRAREAIRTATWDDGKWLEVHARLSALRLRLQLEAATGEFAEAQAMFDSLKKHASVEKDDQQLIDKMQAALDGPSPLAVDGIVPPAEVSDSWSHSLVRRRFDFPKITGTLDHFKLRCGQHGIESPINDQAQWTVPKSWGDCDLYVFGTPGTTFQLVESRP